MFQKIIKKVKKFFLPVFKNTQKGLVVSGSLVAWGIFLGLSGAILYFSYKAGWFGSATEWGVKQIMGILFYTAQTLFGMSSNIFEAIFNSSILQQPMTRGNGIAAATVLHGWAIVRDFANMFIVLGFVVIGIATILRIREYEAQKKLLPLIIVALLINFSLLICGIVIDATNITINYFTQISGPTGIIQPYTNIVMDPETQEKIQENVGDIDKNMLKYISANMSLSILTGISAMIFFIYGILFLFRYVALMLLVILSPLAFVCSVFPATKSVYEKWKTQFLQWAIIGIPTAFFIYLAGHFFVYFSSMPAGGGVSGVDVAGANLAFWIPTAFLLFAYSLIFQTSAIGASAAMGLATGAVGYAVGVSKWAGGKALRATASATGATRLGSAAKDTATGFGERIGLVRAGTTAANQRSRLSEKGRENRINAMSAEEKVQELQRTRWGREGLLDRAKIVESLAKNNQLDMINNAHGFSPAQREALITGAMQYGVRPKDLVGGMQSADIAGIINNNQHDAETRAEAFKTLTKRKHLDLIQHPTSPALTPTLRQTAINEAIQHGARPEEIEKADYHYGEHNMARLDRIAQANFGGNFTTRPAADQATIRQQAIEQTLDENITSMDHDQLRSIDSAHLTHRRVDKLTPDKISAFQNAPRTSRTMIHNHFAAGGQLRQDMDDAWTEYDAARRRGDSAEATNRYTEYRRLLSLHNSATRLP